MQYANVVITIFSYYTSLIQSAT